MKATHTIRNIFLAVLALLVLAGAFWWWRAGAPTADEAKEKAVKFSMEVLSMSITDIKEGRMKGANKVVIKNPMPIKLSASRLDYAVLIDSIKVAEGTYTRAFELPASGSDTLSLPMEIMLDPMARVIERMDKAGKDTANYTFLNTIHTDVPIAGKTSFDFNLEERMPVVRLPEVKPGKLDLEKLGLRTSGLEMVMHVTNPNPFSIRMADGEYAMTIDGENTMEGSLQEVVNLPAKETTDVQMNMEMKTGQTLKTGWKMLFDRKYTRYEITFKSKILSDQKLLKNSSMHFREEGKLQELKKSLEKE